MSIAQWSTTQGEAHLFLVGDAAAHVIHQRNEWHLTLQVKIQDRIHLVSVEELAVHLCYVVNKCGIPDVLVQRLEDAVVILAVHNL